MFIENNLWESYENRNWKNLVENFFLFLKICLVNREMKLKHFISK